MRAALLFAALLLASPARADDAVQCSAALGRGWPPATENYGTAVERLFDRSETAALSFTLLPAGQAEERGLVLLPGADGADWKLRYAEAEERVNVWTNDRLELRTAQTPDIQEVPMPAGVGMRLFAEWMHALAAAAPEGSTAPFSEKDTWLFRAGELRVSGLRPDCGIGEQLQKQIDLLVEATGEGVEKRAKRWRQLGEMLDRLRETVDGPSAVAEKPAEDGKAESKRGWSLFK